VRPIPEFTKGDAVRQLWDRWEREGRSQEAIAIGLATAELMALRDLLIEKGLITKAEHDAKVIAEIEKIPHSPPPS
jgi:uroporphyrinogen-III synthase